MSEICRVGIIGCGSRVRHIAKNLESANSRVQITALADPCEESVKMTRELFGREIPATNDHKQLCAKADIDWVMIGSWNCQHRSHAIDAMQAGKDVFCEKPLATNLEDCLKIRKVRDETGKKLYMGFTLRHAPHYRKIREILDSGTIGEIISFEFNETLDFNHGGFIHQDWRRNTKHAGTHLLEKCCHDIDLAIWMIDSLPMQVAGFGGLDFFIPENKHHIDRIGPNSEGKTAFRLWRCVTDCTDPFTCDKDILDNQVAIMQFANGVRATFHTNCLAGIPERRMYILGTEGAIRADVLTGKIEVRQIGWDAPSVLYDNPGGGHGGGDEIMVGEIAESMLENAAPKATLEDGLLSAITCFGMDDATDNARIVDLTDMWNKAGVTIR